MGKPVINPPKKKSKRSSDAGISVTELLVVIVVIGVVSSFALASFLTAGKSAKLSGATRTLSTYLEKAHVDSVRRHGGASVNLTGSATARTITLPPGTSLQYSLPPATTSIDPATTPLTITYDWRGRAGSKVLITVTDSTTGVGSSTVSVGAVGDVSTDTTVSGPVSTPTPQTTVSTTAGIKSMNY